MKPPVGHSGTAHTKDSAPQATLCHTAGPTQLEPHRPTGNHPTYRNASGCHVELLGCQCSGKYFSVPNFFFMATQEGPHLLNQKKTHPYVCGASYFAPPRPANSTRTRSSLQTELGRQRPPPLPWRSHAPGLGLNRVDSPSQCHLGAPESSFGVRAICPAKSVNCLAFHTNMTLPQPTETVAFLVLPARTTPKAHQRVELLLVFAVDRLEGRNPKVGLGAHEPPQCLCRQLLRWQRFHASGKRKGGNCCLCL